MNAQEFFVISKGGLMYKDSLPPELSRRWGNLQFVKQRDHNEWSAECPQCSDGGHTGRDWPDRFRMWLNPARGWCRRCGYQDFADSDKPTRKITDEERERWLKERLEREEEAKRKAEHAIALLRKEQEWLDWHKKMSVVGQRWWESKGIHPGLQEVYKLGWCTSRMFWSGQSEFTTPTATIPIFSPGWELQNIRHRLIRPMSANDKYRPDRAGLPQALFHTNPDITPQGQAIVVEGEIKSIVVFDRLSDIDDYYVVGTPGKSIKMELLNDIKDNCDVVYIVFDPDAKLQAWKTARYIGDAARVVTIGQKPDDALLDGMTARQFVEAMRYGREL